MSTSSNGRRPNSRRAHVISPSEPLWAGKASPRCTSMRYRLQPAHQHDTMNSVRLSDMKSANAWYESDESVRWHDYLPMSPGMRESNGSGLSRTGSHEESPTLAHHLRTVRDFVSAQREILGHHAEINLKITQVERRRSLRPRTLRCRASGFSADKTAIFRWSLSSSLALAPLERTG